MSNLQRNQNITEMNNEAFTICTAPTKQITNKLKQYGKERLENIFR